MVLAVVAAWLSPFGPAGTAAPGPAAAAAADADPATSLYRITDLGALGPSGARYAFAINDHGDVVGGLANGNAYRYRPGPDPLTVGTIEDLGSGLAATLSENGTVFGDGRGTSTGGTPRAVTPNGAVAAGSAFQPGIIDPAYGTGVSVPGIWTQAGGWNSLYDDGCVRPGLKGGAALAINAGGTLVGMGLVGDTGYPQTGVHAVALKCIPDPAHPGSYNSYDLSPGSEFVAGAFAINKRGVVAGYAQSSGLGGLEAHRWTGEGFSLQADRLGTFAQGHLPDARGSSSAAYGINDLGDIVGAYGPSISNPYLMVGVPFNRAFVYFGDDTKMQDLTDLIPADSGWTLHTAFDINNRGQVVGQGTKNGELRGFLLTPRGDSNITADRIVVTQVVQNEENLDILIAHKQAYAILRVHSDTRPVPGAGAVLRGYRNGQLLGQVDPVSAPIAILQAPDTADALDSFVFAIPPGWTDRGSLRLEATVNGDHDVVETRYTDNEPPPVTVTFLESAPVKIVVVDTYFARNPVASPDAEAFTRLRDRMRLLLPAWELDIRHESVPREIVEPASAGIAKCTDVLNTLKPLRAALNLDDRTLLYGLVPAEPNGNSPYEPYAGCAFTPGLVQTGWSGPGGEDTAVHEYIHALGRQHTPVCNAAGSNPDPYPPDPSGKALVKLGSLHRDSFTLAGDQDLGFDRSTLTFLPPDSTSDIMGYCRPRWMSDYTYENVFRIIRGPVAPPPDLEPGPGKRADVVGTIDLIDGTADLSVTESPIAGTRLSEPDPGPYHLELYDGPTKVDDVPFGADPVEGDGDSRGDAPPVVGFSVAARIPTGVDRVAIFDDRTGTEIGSATLGGATPTISVTDPQAADSLPASGSLSVSWQSDDADGDPLSHTVLYRPADDEPFVLASNETSGSSTTIDAATLAGSSDGTIRVVVTDGLHVSYDDVTGLVVPDKPPTATIDEPTDGAAVTVEQDVLLSGHGSSPQGPLADAAYEWSSDRDGLLGTGPSVVASSLSIGTHEIELRVTASDGQAATATTTVVVGGAGTTPSRLEVSHQQLAFSGSPSSPPVAQSFGVHDPSGASTEWTAESNDPRVSLSATSGSTPGKIDVSVDGSGLLGGESYTADVTVRRADGSQDPLVVHVDVQSSLRTASQSTDHLDFGRRAIGASGAAKTITFTNHAAGSLTLGATALAGPTPDDYELTSDSCSNATLVSGQACTVDVSFVPVAVGSRPAFVVFGDAATDAKWYVSLSGRAAYSFESKLVAWGANDKGELGVAGSPTCTLGVACESAPVEVAGLSDVVQIATTSNIIASEVDHTLVLKADGTVWAFGANNAGQLGNGTRGTGGPTPVQVQGLSDVKAIAVASQYSIALKNDGTVWHWGVNPLSFFSPTLTLPTPVPGVGEVGTLTDVVAIAGGNPLSGCGAPPTGYAIKTDGTVVDWSSSLYGLGGETTSTDCYGGWVVQVHKNVDFTTNQLLDQVVEVAPGIARRSDGSVWTWGGNNYGEMGNGSQFGTYPFANPVYNAAGTAPLTGMIAIASAESQRYALGGDGALWAWGAGPTYGQAQQELGVGTASVARVLRPMRVQISTPVVAAQPGIAVTADGTTYGWGDNSLGQAGVGTLTTVFPPQPVVGIGGTGSLEGVTVFAGGANHHLAVTSVGQGPPSTLSAGDPAAVSVAAGEAFDGLVGTFGDSTASDAFDFSATVDWGDGSEPSSAVVTGPDGGPYEVRASHVYGRAGSFDLTIDVAGRAGDSVALTGSASVGAATLTAETTGAVGFAAGTPASQQLASFTSSNPASTGSLFAATVDWGDGSAPSVATVSGPPGGPFGVVGEHTYRVAGTYPLSVHVVGDDGETVTLATSAVVASASLTPGNSFSTDVDAGTAFSGPVASFADGNPLSRASDYSALIDWGDGDETAGAVSGPNGGPYTVDGAHTYGDARPFTASVTLTGPAGATATATTTLLAQHQRIDLSVVASPAAGEPPLATTFAYTVTNAGTERMWAVEVHGTACESATFATGDDGNGALDPGEEWTYACDHVLDSTGTFTEVAWATAQPLTEGLAIRSENATTEVTVGDTTPPVVTVTGVTDGATYAAGTVPVAGCTTVDPEPGSGVATEATPVTTGGPTDFTVTCSGAMDVAGNPGNTAVASYHVSSTYAFSGFKTPVDDRPTLNKAKAGSSIPVRFSLGGDRGLAIFADGSPRSQLMTCGTAMDVDAIEQTVAAGASSLTYAAGSDTYTYVWKTETAWRNTCRQLVITFADGSVARADFLFSK
ncbi:MAG TPA: PxKF domain-containing protein [Acidimicrobiia bacterium]|nr:PxKF domain-containing protein [Acidimicrobiia bacterium]